jgi:phosphopantothenoylcysteine decarboxylase / phosphopantothenate---cysteine ligase
MLKGKNILIGVTGGIAAYKTATIIRLLVKEGASVKVVMTPAAKEFITPLTLATLSGNPVMTDFFDPENGDWNSHVLLGSWADLYLIAPATANSIAKMASGIADNLLLTTYLSVRCPVFIAPAMDLEMFKHTATVRNIDLLKLSGNQFIDAEWGELASGLSGKGRMAEPEEIVKRVIDFFSKKKTNKPLRNKRVLINAGPTYEAIDPVRFIGNFSSGKMGIALANEAVLTGAEVDLVLGPVSISPENPAINVTHVTSAAEMAEACLEHFRDCDIAILSAAVADFTPEKIETRKVKRGKDGMVIKLVPTVDIAAALGKNKRKGQVLAGFALETDNELINAKDKLIRKNLDLVILNSLKDQGSGFGYDTNKVTIIDKYNNIDKFELKSKEAVAKDILAKIVTMIK